MGWGVYSEISSGVVWVRSAGVYWDCFTFTDIVLLCYYLCCPVYWLCVLYHCHRVLTQLQLTYISISIVVLVSLVWRREIMFFMNQHSINVRVLKIKNKVLCTRAHADEMCCVAVAYREGGLGCSNPPPRNSEDIGGVLDRMSKNNRRLDFLLQFTVFSYGCNLLNKGFF